MAVLQLNQETVEAVVLGGGVLGGGGGGSLDDGRTNGLLAIQWGAPPLVDLADLPGDAVLVTASAVGSPASKTTYAPPVHFVRSIELLRDMGGVRVAGIITSECGGIAATNGWMQAAALGLPVVDSPCNGRAHPIGVMGSMGLHEQPGYVSLQTAVGGNPAENRYVEMFVRGKLEKAAALVLQAAVQAGGMVAVARNPVTVDYAHDHAAPGALKRAIAVGRAMLDRLGAGPLAMVEAAASTLDGEIAGRGPIVAVELETRGGLDVGTVKIANGQGRRLELTFWNEYMTLEAFDDGRGSGATRVATFPDLMATFDLATGTPVTTAQARVGIEVAVLRVPRQKLILGAGMRYPALMRAVEEAVGREVLRYIS